MAAQIRVSLMVYAVARSPFTTEYTMTIVRTAAIALLLSSASAAFAHDRQPPEQTQGLKPEVIFDHQLAAQIPVADGYRLRMRKVTFEPGGAIKKHLHDKRPGMVYVLEGEVTEFRGPAQRVVAAGEAILEAVDTDHWVENLSDAPATLLVIDIPKDK